MIKYWKSLELHTKIIIALILGAVAGVVFEQRIVFVKPAGDLFLKLITMVVLPLVFSSLFVGTASLGDIKKLGRIGAKTLLYYFITTVVAITIGLLLVNTIKPGKYIKGETKKELYKNYSKGSVDVSSIKKATLSETLLNIVPKNPAKSFTEANMLQIIFLAMIFGIGATYLPDEKSAPMIDFFSSLSDTTIKVVDIVMKYAPYGVFALIAAIIGKYGYKILITLLTYSLTVILGLLIHTFIILPVFVKLLGKVNVKEFLKKMSNVMLIAFSTSSSNATLPVTMETVEKKFDVPPYISSFVLPLGATINMNGTALYQGVATVFIAQVYGIKLGLSSQLTIVLTATLAAVGTAGVPGVGIIMLAMILTAVNVPLEGIALILGVDRILDMLRTVSNVLGDASCAIVITKSEKKE